MASNLDIAKKLERNKKWLATSLKEMERNTQHMLKLIEDDGDSFARRADLYYQRRPELIEDVHEFERMYQTLAGQYEQMMVDVSTDMQLHAPVAPEVESEPSTPRVPAVNRYRSFTRAPGFDYFLRNVSDLSREVFPVPYFEEPGASSVHNYPRIPLRSSEEALNERNIQIGSENVGLMELQLKIASYEVEIAKLKTELTEARPLNITNSQGDISLNNMSETDGQGVDVNSSTDTEVSDPEKVRALFDDLKVAKERIQNLGVQIEKMKSENNLAHEFIHDLQNQIKEAQKDAAAMRSQLVSATTKASKRKNETVRLKDTLKDRDVEIRGLNAALAEDNNKSQMHAEFSRLKIEKDRIEAKLGELEVYCHTMEIQHAEAKKKMSDEIEQLKVDSEKRDGLKVDTGLSNELEIRVGELEGEVERQRMLVLEAAEEKREAIRQLSFSLEHYRNGYEQLREVTKQKGHPVRIAS